MKLIVVKLDKHKTTIDFDGTRKHLTNIEQKFSGSTAYLSELVREIQSFPHIAQSLGVIIDGTEWRHFVPTWFEIFGDSLDMRSYLSEQLNLPVLHCSEISNLQDEHAVRQLLSAQTIFQQTHIIYTGISTGKAEKGKQSLLTLGNGYLGLRGAPIESTSSKDHYPGLYMAGLYNQLMTPIAGKEIINEDFVNLPNPQYISFAIADEQPFQLTNDVIESLYRELDIETGILTTKMIVCDQKNHRLEVHSQKCVSMENKHLLGISYTITPLNFTGSMQVFTQLEGQPVNDGVERYRDLTNNHLNCLAFDTDDRSTICLHVQTKTSKIDVAIAAKFSYQAEQPAIIFLSDTCVKQSFQLHVEQRTSYTFEKIVSITSSSGNGATDSLIADAKKQIDTSFNFLQLWQKSRRSWSAYWKKMDIVITGDLMSQKLIRLNTYHMLVAASLHTKDLDVSITARGLHGEAYRGHIFWDELFILPLYDIHFPEIARGALRYRYRRLQAAKDNAKKAGYAGAMYPWQSGLLGDEQTQTIHLNPLTNSWGPDYSCLQRHVSLAIAYNVWQYVHITDDMLFMHEYGLEMLVEIAKFWLSMAQYDVTCGKYSISGVMGPDEFHESYHGATEGGVQDNAYTNIMVLWLLETIETLWEQSLQTNAYSTKHIQYFSHNELQKSRNLRQHLHLEIRDGILAQFVGYFDLKEVDFSAYRQKYANIYRMDRILKAEGDNADAYQVAKQADALMLFYNLDIDKITHIINQLGYDLPSDYVAQNLKYYLERTSHGSTLSRVVHAYLAQLIQDKQLSWDLFYTSLQSDYADIQGGTAAEGIHTGVMSATIMTALTAFAGVNLRNDMLQLAPQLPDRWQSIQFQLDFRKNKYNICLTHKEIKISAEVSTTVLINGKRYHLDKQALQTIVYV